MQTSAMKIGYYSIELGLHHTYAIVDDHINFQCYGGINGNNNKYPVHFWSPFKPYAENPAILNCNANIARVLAEFRIPQDFTRTDYNHKSGGYLNQGDSSGIIYGYTGVCHQMCNTITVATNEDYFNATINWPPISFYLSASLYGVRGWLDQPERVALIYGLINKYYRITENDFSFRDNELDELYNAYHKKLRAQLDTVPLKEERTIYLENLITQVKGSSLQDSPKLMPPIAEADANVQKIKHELDNMLIRGQVSYDEYAGGVNKALADMVTRYAEILSPEDFEKIFQQKPGETPIILIDPDLMPDTYEGVKEVLQVFGDL